MSKRNNRGSSDQHHQRASEMHNNAAHAHVVAAAAHEKQDHQTGHERSRQAHEHSAELHDGSENGRGVVPHEDIAVLAHGLWEARGCPHGSPDEDWFHAGQQLHVLGQRSQE